MSILDSYPTVQEAVAWYEYLMCIPADDGEPSPHGTFLQENIDIDTAMKMIREVADSEIGDPDCVEISQEKMQTICQQLRLPEFRSYLASKFGMM